MTLQQVLLNIERCLNVRTFRYPQVVDDHGAVVGEIQGLGGILSPYKAVGVCLHKSHLGRCRRQRAWKVSQEMPHQVGRVLAAWILSAPQYATTRAHMDDAPRQ